MTHVRTSPYYPQSNGKLERWHKSLKSECIRPGVPLTPEDARRLIQRYVEHYNTVRLHSAIGFVTPEDLLAGRRDEIHAARDRKLEQARQQRQLRRPVLTPAATLGFAIASPNPNDTLKNAERSASCRILLEDTQRTNLGEATLAVPAKSNRSQLLNAAISIPGTFRVPSA